MRISLCTLLNFMDVDRDMRKAVKRWLRLSKKRPYDKFIGAEWHSNKNRFQVKYV